MQHAFINDRFDASEADLYFYGTQTELFEVTIFEPDVIRDTLPESLLHSIWQNGQFHNQDLKSTAGEPIEIINAGTLNQDAGPDFLNAILVIDGTRWVGDIELHKSSKEWFSHRHHHNSRYNSTILHVTLFQDPATGSLTRQDESIIPELVLSPLLKSPLRSLLFSHHHNRNNLACTAYQSKIKGESVQEWIKSLGFKRLLRKKQQVERAFLSTPNLEVILHKLLFSGLGYAKNCEPMLSLAERLPIDLIRSIADPLDIEALHLGIAGLLPDIEVVEDPVIRSYVERTNLRFQRLKASMKMPAMPFNAWQFFRLRPANFPTVRVAQASALYQKAGVLNVDALGALGNVLLQSTGKPALQAIYQLLQIPPSDFWKTHFHFRKSSHVRSARIGQSRLIKLLLNAILPVMLVHADLTNNLTIENNIINLVNFIKAEKDLTVKQFDALEIEYANAYYTQGLHELYTDWCLKGRCLQCQIGKSLIHNNLGHET